ncbi:MAG TPA: M14 family zinc carboxypeptidase [Aequorivita sp.]|nr:M14 family zinc carboxypeptidase [Aequorivita sp.]
MKITDWYQANFEDHLSGRYITLDHIDPLLEKYRHHFKISIAGISEQKKSIPLIKIGQGSRVVLAWSQMHGNESTTTKAIFDFLKFLVQKEVYREELETFLSSYTFYVLPMLNPDGAAAYTRENANGVDLNRDAQELSQAESVCLREVFDELQPSLCLNLHDQRSIYGLDNGNPATVSFLSPAADGALTHTESRKTAMSLIVKMNNFLQNFLAGQVGRYDDSYNPACIGDTFQSAGVPTILFEAGHYKMDYQREKTREFIFYAFLALFDIVDCRDKKPDYEEYFKIPENRKNYNDFILRNVSFPKASRPLDLAIQYSEALRDGSIEFEAIIDEIGQLDSKFGHKEQNAHSNEILTKTQKKLAVGVKVYKIFDKNQENRIYFQAEVF